MYFVIYSNLALSDLHSVRIDRSYYLIWILNAYPAHLPFLGIRIFKGNKDVRIYEFVPHHHLLRVQFD